MGSVPNAAGAAHGALPDPYMVGRGLVPPPQEPDPRCRLSALRSCPNKKSWARPWPEPHSCIGNGLPTIVNAALFAIQKCTVRVRCVKMAASVKRILMPEHSGACVSRSIQDVSVIQVMQACVTVCVCVCVCVCAQKNWTSIRLAVPELSVGWVDPRVGLGLVGNGSKICAFNGLGWVMGLKWQMCEKYTSCIYVTLWRVSTGKFVFWKLVVCASLLHLSEIGLIGL